VDKTAGSKAALARRLPDVRLFSDQPTDKECQAVALLQRSAPSPSKLFAVRPRHGGSWRYCAM